MNIPFLSNSKSTLISYTHNFAFVHIYKTGGNSIRSVLQPYVTIPKESPVDIFKQKIGILPDTTKLSKHIKAKRLKAELGEDLYQNLFTFSIVRNPWAWQVSLYHYALKNKSLPQHELIKSFANFDQYIKWRVKADLHTQSEFVYDSSGNLLVDYVGKTKTIQQDFDHICRQIGIPQIKLPHKNKTKHKPYQHYYNSQTKRLVHRAFKSDINNFNYSFSSQ